MASSSGQQSGSYWDLSLYDTHRKPHEVVTDNSIIGVSPRSLHSELMCPICLDIMKNTQTTKECLHRFCQECIITALRSGNKECPTCRKKLVSKRSLRPDPNFDALIAKIYPNREDLVQQEPKPGRPALTPGLTGRKRRAHTPSASPPPPNDKVHHGYEDDTTSVLDDQSRAPSEEESADVKVEFQLRPNPLDASVANHLIRNLTSTPNASVAHLVKFLNVSKGSNSCGGVYKLSAGLGSEEQDYVELPLSTTLKQICDTYWVPGEKLKLYFSRKEEISNI